MSDIEINNDSDLSEEEELSDMEETDKTYNIVKNNKKTLHIIPESNDFTPDFLSVNEIACLLTKRNELLRKSTNKYYCELSNEDIKNQISLEKICVKEYENNKCPINIMRIIKETDTDVYAVIKNPNKAKNINKIPKF